MVLHRRLCRIPVARPPGLRPALPLHHSYPLRPVHHPRPAGRHPNLPEYLHRPASGYGARIPSPARRLSAVVPGAAADLHLLLPVGGRVLFWRPGRTTLGSGYPADKPVALWHQRPPVRAGHILLRHQPASPPGNSGMVFLAYHHSNRNVGGPSWAHIRPSRAEFCAGPPYPAAHSRPGNLPDADPGLPPRSEHLRTGPVRRGCGYRGNLHRH